MSQSRIPNLSSSRPQPWAGAFDDALGQGAARSGDHAVPAGTAETRLRTGAGHSAFSSRSCAASASSISSARA